MRGGTLKRGAPIPFTPQIFSTLGWVVPTILFLLFAVISAFAVLFIIEAMQAIPGNRHFQGTVEFSTLINFYFGPWQHIVGQLFLYAAIQSQCIQNMVVSSQTLDNLVIAIFHKTCGLAWPGGGSTFKWVCVNATSAASGSPFVQADDTAIAMVFTVGLLIVAALCVPLAMLNLDDNIQLQVGAFMLTIVILSQWVLSSCLSGLHLDRVPTAALRSGWQNQVGTIMQNMACTTFVPSWINLKKKNVNAQATVWTAMAIAVFGYIVVGVFPALAFDATGESILPALSHFGVPHSLTVATCYAFAIVMLLPSIPVSCIVAENNLTQNRVVILSDKQKELLKSIHVASSTIANFIDGKGGKKKNLKAGLRRTTTRWGMQGDGNLHRSLRRPTFRGFSITSGAEGKDGDKVNRNDSSSSKSRAPAAQSDWNGSLPRNSEYTIAENDPEVQEPTRTEDAVGARQHLDIEGVAAAGDVDSIGSKRNSSRGQVRFDAEETADAEESSQTVPPSDVDEFWINEAVPDPDAEDDSDVERSKLGVNLNMFRKITMRRGSRFTGSVISTGATGSISRPTSPIASTSRPLSPLKENRTSDTSFLASLRQKPSTSTIDVEPGQDPDAIALQEVDLRAGARSLPSSIPRSLPSSIRTSEIQAFAGDSDVLASVPSPPLTLPRSNSTDKLLKPVTNISASQSEGGSVEDGGTQQRKLSGFMMTVKRGSSPSRIIRGDDEGDGELKRKTTLPTHPDFVAPAFRSVPKWLKMRGWVLATTLGVITLLLSAINIAVIDGPYLDLELYRFLHFYGSRPSVDGGLADMPTEEAIHSLLARLDAKLTEKAEADGYGSPFAHCDSDREFGGNGTEELEEYQESHRGRACGHVFEQGEGVYHCKTCALDPTCVFCYKCFRGSTHEGHETTFSISSGNGGCCDCGDAEAWRIQPDCKYHSTDNRGDAMIETRSINDVCEPIPKALAASIRMTVATVLDFIVDCLGASPADCVLKSLEAVRMSNPPDLVPKPEGFNDEVVAGDRYACILWNDESHSFLDVINVVMTATNCSSSAAETVATNVDAKVLFGHRPFVTTHTLLNRDEMWGHNFNTRLDPTNK
ncbi:hypothetical protein HK101_001345 [Irineochytrium annulatum]|nr:hypothetical protein HK101_001345 [Irineochytrium annulatum]